jgi:hypothetical protein
VTFKPPEEDEFHPAADTLRHYLQSRPTTDTPHLFVGQTELIGRPLSTGAICAVIDRAYERCGFLHWFGTHHGCPAKHLMNFRKPALACE